MREAIKSEHWNDAEGNPEGGTTFGNGFAIAWQRGPLGQHSPDCLPAGHCVKSCERKPPNGAFVEDVIEACIDRLDFYQSSVFNCERNGHAIDDLRAALDELSRRTADRSERGVEGTHEA